MEDFMRDSGKMIKDMDRGMNFSPITILIWVTMLMENLKVKEFINGLMEKLMKGNGFRALRKVMEFGKVQKMNPILGNGNKIKQMVLEYTFGKLAINTKENGQLA